MQWGGLEGCVVWVSLILRTICYLQQKHHYYLIPFEVHEQTLLTLLEKKKPYINKCMIISNYRNTKRRLFCLSA